MSLYGNNEHKQRGILREPLVANRILEFLNSKGLTITMKHSDLIDDMLKKYDYEYSCNIYESFAKHDNINKIKVDIKCGTTFTLFDTIGRNTLTNSESVFIVFELYPDADKLLWVNTEKFKECLQKYPPILYESKQEGNFSKYFYIENYIDVHQKYLGKFIEYIK